MVTDKMRILTAIFIKRIDSNSHLYLSLKNYHNLLKLIVIDIHRSVSAFAKLTVKSSKRFHTITNLLFTDSKHNPSLFIYKVIS
jgi:hypothetical protein